MDADEKAAYEQGKADGLAKKRKAQLAAARKKGEADAQRPTVKESLFAGAKKLMKEASKTV